jgi:hypothetical protein
VLIQKVRKKSTTFLGSILHASNYFKITERPNYLKEGWIWTSNSLQGTTQARGQVRAHVRPERMSGQRPGQIACQVRGQVRAHVRSEVRSEHISGQRSGQGACQTRSHFAGSETGNWK